MPRSPCQPFLSEIYKPRSEHGGDIRRGKRKLSRPLDPRRPVHLVLRSEKARGKLSLWGRGSEVENIAYRSARKYGVKIHKFANSGNHLHLVIKASDKASFQSFLKVMSGKIAQRITGARKGHRFGRFWSALAYTRVLNGFRDFKNACDYVLINQMEAQRVYSGRRKQARAGPHSREVSTEINSPSLQRTRKVIGLQQT